MKDVIFEALFRQAVIDRFEEELAAVPSNDELSRLYSFSEKHILKMRKLFSSDRRIMRAAAFAKWTKRTAAAIVITTTVLFAALMFVPEVRAAVVNTIIEWYEEFTKFTSKGQPPSEPHAWIPEYVPEGYAEIGRTSSAGMISIDYQDTSGNLLFFISSPSDNSLSVNNEDVEYRKEVLDGVEYYIFEGAAADQYNAVICEIDGRQYRLSAEGVLPVDELIKILQSVK